MEQLKLPLRARVYIAFLVVLALITATCLFLKTDWNEVHWFSVGIFLFLSFLTDCYPVTLPRGGVVSVSFASMFASILLFQPFLVVLITVAGDFFSLRKGRSRSQYIFNAAQLTLTSGLSAAIFRLINPNGLVISERYLLAVLASLLFCFIANSSMFTVVLAIIYHENPYSIWLTNVKWATPNFLSMAPLGILVSLIYVHIGFWGLVLFLVPLVLARHSFQSYMDMRRAFLDTMMSLSKVIDAKDPYTRGHSARVAKLAVALARQMKWAEDRVNLFQYVAMIHDVGKVAIPEAILKKPGKLTPTELQEMEQHAPIGSDVIKNITFFQDGAAIIRHHHERWDGTGYPSGLKGESIPLGSRILAIADSFDAMISDRPYRKALPPLEALEEIRSGAGSQFDPKVVKAFEKLFPHLATTFFNRKSATLFTKEAAATMESCLVRETTPESGLTGGGKDKTRKED